MVIATAILCFIAMICIEEMFRRSLAAARLEIAQIKQEFVHNCTTHRQFLSSIVSLNFATMGKSLDSMTLRSILNDPISYRDVVLQFVEISPSRIAISAGKAPFAVAMGGSASILLIAINPIFTIPTLGLLLASVLHLLGLAVYMTVLGRRLKKNYVRHFDPNDNVGWFTGFSF